ncbi:MAG: hypothetical protein M0R46_10025 [Candidatus Muirbacterium halophilum]|nr:hypothetical protein [Candidatus Muirbacterium halophilum]
MKKRILIFIAILVSTNSANAFCYYIDCSPVVTMKINAFNAKADLKFNNVKIQREELYKNYQEYKTTLDKEIVLQKKLLKLKTNNIKELKKILNNREIVLKNSI